MTSIPEHSEDAWNAATDCGKNIVDLHEIAFAASFFAGTAEQRRCRYIVSKHELRAWVERNGRETLIDLLDKLNRGGNFDELYFVE